MVCFNFFQIRVPQQDLLALFLTNSAKRVLHVFFSFYNNIYFAKAVIWHNLLFHYTKFIQYHLQQILQSTYMVIIITEIIMIHSRAGILPQVSRNAETSQYYVPSEGTVRSTNITPTPRYNPESCHNV